MPNGFCPVCNNRSGYDTDYRLEYVCCQCGALFLLTEFGPILMEIDARDRYSDFGDFYKIPAWQNLPIERFKFPEDSKHINEGVVNVVRDWQADHPILDGILCLRQRYTRFHGSVI